MSCRLDRLPRSVLCASLTASMSLPLLAQQPSEPKIPKIFQEVVEVRVVNIEVVVTDRQGNRVSGLQGDDFELRVDGEGVPIDYFSEIVDGRGVGVSNAGSPGRAAVPPGQSVGTNYLVFIDDLFAIARDRDRVLDRLEEQLARLEPDDRMAMVVFDGKTLDMLTPWTDSPSELERALRLARQRDAFGVQHISELRLNDQARQDRLPQERRLPGLTGPDNDFAFRLALKVERSVLAAVSSCRSGPR